jgi:endonuclease/exonuclease/phosphatase family metal-dependent hydrolase
MRIATFNIWNSDIAKRIEQIIQELNSIDVDIIGLQEVPKNYWSIISKNVIYKNSIYYPYEGQDEGLAFFSKYKIIDSFFLNNSNEYNNSLALNIIIEQNGIKISITNVHLPWDSIVLKEKQIIAIDKFIHEQKNIAKFSILLGDFNCTENSSVHHYLLGNQTLLGCEAKPYWNDLATVHAFLNNYKINPTLDFVNNPRWGGKNTNYIPDACDRILIMEPYDWNFEYRLKNVSIFGKNVSTKTGFAPSDHYGLVAEVDFQA